MRISSRIDNDDNLNHIYDFSFKSTPESAASSDSIYEMVIQYPFLYTAGSLGFNIYNISDPQNTTHLAQYGQFYIAMAIHENLVFLAGSNADRYLNIIDISDPSNLTLIGSFNSNTLEECLELSVNAQSVFYIDGLHGLTVFNVADPTNPAIIGTIETDSYQGGGFLIDSYLYVRRVALNPNSYGIEIVDVSDPSTPNSVGIYNINTYYESLFNEAGIFYSLDLSGQFQQLDLSVRTQPEDIGSPIDCNKVNFRMADIEGDIVAFCKYSEGITIYNIADPSNVTQIAINENFSDDYYVLTQQIWGEYLFAGIYNHGLYVLPLDNIASINPTNTTYGVDINQSGNTSTYISDESSDGLNDDDNDNDSLDDIILFSIEDLYQFTETYLGISKFYTNLLLLGILIFLVIFLLVKLPKRKRKQFSNSPDYEEEYFDY